MNDDPKPEAPFALDVDFGEALARFAQTKPEEVEPAPGRTRKSARPAKRSGGIDEPTSEDVASSSASGSPRGPGAGG